MTVHESIRLSEVFKLIVKPRYILGTTYTLSLAFFETVVFPIINRAKLQSCLIICDRIGYQRALEESSALVCAAQDYMVVQAPREGAFHAKVWLIIGDGEALLLTGSGNLTQAGFMTNAEYFDALLFSADSPASQSMLDSACGFLKGMAGMWSAEESSHLLCVETLARMQAACAALPKGKMRDQAPKFLHSFQGPLIDQLPAVSPVAELYVAAPFFGNRLDGLNLLVARHRPEKLHIFPGVHNGEAIDIPLKEVAETYKGAKVARIAVPGKRDAHAHLKLYGIVEKAGTGWLCCTSANCTTAAWKGSNVEAGLLRSVQHAALAEYFVPGKTELPDESFGYKPDASAADTLYCWASDAGGQLDLDVAASSRPHLPLKNVTLTVSAGSSFATCSKALLFQDTSFIHLPWTAFDGWHRPRKMTVCLHLIAQNAVGRVVRGGCLVENRLLLTADPQHRSAWRGALALLQADGAPELADVAAIFSLARDLFDGTLFSPQHPGIEKENPGKISYALAPLPLAVWPPQPERQEFQVHIAGTAAGHIQWFQRIMQTFLRADTPNDGMIAPVHGLDGQDDDSEESSDSAVRQRELDQQRAQSAAERIWNNARKDCENLQKRLCEICPTERQAPNLWLAAICTFLATLAVLRAAKRMAPNLDCGTSITYLCEEFLYRMLTARKQRDNFCCPINLRYRSETFPPLANDLRYTFKVKIHADLTNVMLALIADWKLRTGLYREMWPRFVKQVCEDEYHADQDNREACRRIWRQYIAYNAVSKTDEEFCSTYDELCRMNIR